MRITVQIKVIFMRSSISVPINRLFSSEKLDYVSNGNPQLLGLHNQSHIDIQAKKRGSDNTLSQIHLS
jgi:hypothetical protein